MKVPNKSSDQDFEVNALAYIGSQRGSSPYLAIGSNSGQLSIINMTTQQVCFSEPDFIPSETMQVHFEAGHDGDSSIGRLLCINADQNLFTYDVALHEKGHRTAHGQQLHLEKIGSKCLYLDEVIDIKLLK
jgi:U3 small nucleolar RNA-associated protein 13